MTRRAKHRRDHRKCCSCCAPLAEELRVANSDIRLMSNMMERVLDEKIRLDTLVRSLRSQMDGNAITQALSLQQIRDQMRRTTPVAVPVSTPAGLTMWLPVGRSEPSRSPRTRPVPAWAASGEAS